MEVFPVSLLQIKTEIFLSTKLWTHCGISYNALTNGPIVDSYAIERMIQSKSQMDICSFLK